MSHCSHFEGSENMPSPLAETYKVCFIRYVTAWGQALAAFPVEGEPVTDLFKSNLPGIFELHRQIFDHNVTNKEVRFEK